MGHPGPPGPVGHGHQGPGAELRLVGRQPADRDVQLHEQGPQGVPGDHARVAQRGAGQLASAATRCRPPSTSRSRSTTSSSPRRTSTGRRTRTGIDGSHRRPDLRQLHDPVRPGPGEDPQDRRPAAEAHRGLALAGLRDARQAGARSGPEGGHRRLHHRRALPDHLLPRPRRHRDGRAVHLRALLLRADQADPDHADAAGHRGPDPDARRRRRREHRRLRTRERGGTRREIGRHRRSSRATARA